MPINAFYGRFCSLEIMENQYATVIESPVGKISILSDGHFINAILFDENPAQGLDSDMLSKKAAAQLELYFEGKLQVFDFPIQQKGTEFQLEVWDNLCAIPFGETTSYAKFSAHKPLAIRAIASANGKNKLNIVVPCHRVIGSNGKLVGYGGGLWRKKWLLDHERELSNTGQTELKF